MLEACGRVDADHSHVFCSCVRIQLFWNVIQIVEQLLHLEALRDPRITYLGLIPGEGIEKKETYLFKILTVATKKALARNWMKSDPPEAKTMAGHMSRGKTDFWL